MKKAIIILFALVCSGLSVQAQNSVNITGNVYENTSKEAVEYASIRVLNAKDSTFVAGITTNEKGRFNLGVKPNEYILHVSFLGYADYYEKFDANAKKSFGDIFLKDDGIFLTEAVVTGQAVEIQVMGDTIQYNADSYKVQESAVLEDLLKKMPGVEIDENGKITVNGKEIKKIMVDGKEFFTDDPKVASKNLPAKMIDKVQVLDKLSEMAEMTGFDDDDEETVINLTIKKGMKQGFFGNAFAGYGSKDRYEGNALLNYMKNDTQMTALGGANNTNNAGASDLASSMGGGGRGGMRFGGSNGITKAANGGFNMAMETSDKFKWSGDIQYNTNDNDVITKSNRQYTTEDERTSITNSWGNNDSQNINSNLRLEWTPDSLTRIIFRPSVQYGRNIRTQDSDEELFMPYEDTGGYNSQSSYFSSGKNLRFNGRLFMSRKLNNKGRTVSLSLSGGNNDSDSYGNESFDRIYNDPNRNDSIFNQIFNQDDKTNNIGAYLSYVEPIGRNNFLQLSYNIRSNNSETDKIAYNKVGNDYTELSEDHTRLVKNNFVNQNVTLSFRSVRKKFNYTLGVGLEPSSSKTEIDIPQEGLKNPGRKTFLSFAPNGTFNYLWDKRHTLRVRYRGRTSQPSTMQLFDGITSSSGSSTTRGNPDLKPSFTHNVNLRYQKSDPVTASMLMVIGNFNHISNSITSISKWNNVEEREITYANINGDLNGNMRVMFNTPLRNKKFSFNTMTYGSYRRNNSIIDDEKNRANIVTLNEHVGIRYNSDIFDFNVRGNIGYENMKNSNGRNNRDSYTYGGNASVTGYLPFDFTIETDINYSANSGYSGGFQRNEWLWNAAVSKQIFKNKAGTIRFKIYDILKERSNITRTNSVEYIEDNITNSLNSYFMVHFVYRFQIFSGGATAPQTDPFGRGGHRGGGGRPPHG